MGVGVNGGEVGLKIMGYNSILFCFIKSKSWLTLIYINLLLAQITHAPGFYPYYSIMKILFKAFQRNEWSVLE